MAVVKAFYAYPGLKTDLTEDIHDAVRLINESKIISITTWEDLSIGGRYIIDGILDAIDRCDLFICDLTYLNFNVLYELGYAISKEKKIWITLNKSHAKARANYKAFSLITTIGYAGYENSRELVEKFYSELPHETSQNIIQYSQESLNKHLVYLACENSTSASNILKITLGKSEIPIKIDDPYEGSQPLSWYLNVLQDSFGIVIHFHTSESQVENPIPTGRKALIAGIAKGLGLKTLLLAHSPFEKPLDYHDSLIVHVSASQCEKAIKEWLEPIIEEYKVSVDDHKEYITGQKALGKISNLIMGDYVAENENHDLVHYFLETAEYKEALIAQQVLFVGRKGTGKTANLLKIKNELTIDKRNFIISIQPQGHEFEGVLNILNNLKNESEQAHLIESVWKHLIYTEIAKQYYEYLDSLPLHYQKNKDEQEFIDFVKQNERLINADFTLRLENIVSNLTSSLKKSDSTEQQRYKVSEYLHDNIIKHLRNYLGKVLEKREKVTILIDNLDKSWNDKADLKKLSELLFGLLNVVHKISDEFQKNSYKYQKVNISLIVFLRSDIFSRITSYASEIDKVPIKHLSWSDYSLLFRVIENRIKYSNNGITSPDVLWNQYFCQEVNGIPLKKYIENLILPRPRDIIFLFKMALQEAVNRGHVKVEEEDFKSAEFAYSDYAIKSLFPENGGRIEDIEIIFYAFAGEKSILTQEEIENCIKKYSKQNINEVLNILCEMTFIGQEIAEDEYEYYSEKRSRKITDILAEKLAVRNSRSKRYKINPAFHAHLGIENN
ncbi:hypothetical protein AM499_17330 [Bacillus sp. FJAT-22090]|uniref:P-loop ATPase, Sll1717 family n=1 Tax=Bacillus sp. FJAT-22090 TaxID=1581038 RepID=UPI0006AEC10D|nr:hypothetical protein [Bacillus sp. FJAT-22090]ALC87378.1 hypothetical protein AM499_17330 [Bacillus sp. FJAT-22090]